MSSDKHYPVLLHSGRLVARTPAFQVGEAGSKPVRSTKFRMLTAKIIHLTFNQKRKNASCFILMFIRRTT